MFRRPLISLMALVAAQTFWAAPGLADDWTTSLQNSYEVPYNPERQAIDDWIKLLAQKIESEGIPYPKECNTDDCQVIQPTRIALEVTGNGSIKKVRILKSSGNRLIDLAVYDGIWKLQPLPQVPKYGHVLHVEFPVLPNRHQ